MKSLKHTAAAAVILAVLMCAAVVPAAAADVTVDTADLYCFSPEDFTVYSEDDGIFITSVPDPAVANVIHSGRVLKAGDALPKDALSRLTLETVCMTKQTASIHYCTVSNGTVSEPRELRFSILPAKNEPPTVENSSFETYRNIANTGSLSAADPEGKPLTYTLVKEPKRGTVELHEGGTFTYTPNKNKVGKDSFSFTATDQAGNTSEPATVSIRILKPTDTTTYADMAAHPDAFYAMWLKEAGLFTGATVGGNLCFSPDETVSRGDFLVMIMQLVGAPADTAQMTSGFADEAETPVWLRPYIVSALSGGMISGAATESGVVFRPDAALTRAETVVLLQNILKLPAPDAAAVFAVSDDSLPAWAEDAAASVAAAGLVVEASAEAEAITRADAARLLYHVGRMLDSNSVTTRFPFS